MINKFLNPLDNLKLIWKLCFYLNILFIIALLIAYLTPFVDPRNFWMFAIFGLTFPIVLVGNIIFILIWLIVKKSNALYSGIVVLSGFFYLTDFFAFNINSEKAPKDTIKVMSYNVRLFDLYNWKENRETKQNIFDFLEKENADILCFQEFYERQDDYIFETRTVLEKLLPTKNHYEHYTHSMNKKEHFGVATYSRFPIVSKGFIEFENEETNTCIYTDLKIKNDTIRVYNTHMGSIRFNAADYEYLGDNNTKFKANRKGSSQILNRLKIAYKKRATQAELILNHAATSPYEVLICGDFNDIPISYTYQLFKEKYIDSFTESGFGIGKTYIGKIPSYRIDYIWHSENLKSFEFTVHEPELSDHRAISCFIKIN